MAISGISGMTSIWLEGLGGSLQVDGKALTDAKSIETTGRVEAATRSSMCLGSGGWRGE